MLCFSFRWYFISAAYIIRLYSLNVIFIAFDAACKFFFFFKCRENDNIIIEAKIGNNNSTFFLLLFNFFLNFFSKSIDRMHLESNRKFAIQRIRILLFPEACIILKNMLFLRRRSCL